MSEQKKTALHVCEMCEYRPLGEFAVPGSCTLWHCPACGLYQQGEPAEDAAYAAGYHRGYVKKRSKKVRTAMVRLNRFAPYVDVGKPRLLDIGCSVGCTVEAANARGWLGVGVDVSGDMVDYCRQRGLECHKTNSLQLPFADRSFDIVTAWHVIEHVANVAETLAEWRRVLRPGGLLILETPDANCRKAKVLGAEYRKFWAAEHTYTFTPETLWPFMEKTGFQSLSRPWLGPHYQLQTAHGAVLDLLSKLPGSAAVERTCQSISSLRPSRRIQHERWSVGRLMTI